jgi:NAD(P)-dependent dehydrogenase (short-subunit alcohol dehydrogenase family)
MSSTTLHDSHAPSSHGAEAHAHDAHAHEPAPAAPVRRAKERGAIVVGASSGMGAALVEQLAREGVNVVALARRKPELEALAAKCAGAPGRVIPVVHDVLRDDEVPALFERLVRELGTLDLFIYASGLMTEVGPAEFDTKKDLEMLAVNVGGCIAWTNEVAKLFRTQRSGTSSHQLDRGERAAAARLWHDQGRMNTTRAAQSPRDWRARPQAREPSRRHGCREGAASRAHPPEAEARSLRPRARGNECSAVRGSSRGDPNIPSSLQGQNI